MFERFFLLQKEIDIIAEVISAEAKVSYEIWRKTKFKDRRYLICRTIFVYQVRRLGSGGLVSWEALASHLNRKQSSVRRLLSVYEDDYATDCRFRELANRIDTKINERLCLLDSQ